MVGTGARLKAAVRLGAIPIDFEEVDNPVTKVMQLTGGLGADVVLECAGTKVTCEQSVLMPRKGGRIVMVGIPHEPVTLSWSALVLGEIDLLASRANPNVSEQALSLMASGVVRADAILTHVFPLDEFSDALATFVEQRDGATKVVVNP